MDLDDLLAAVEGDDPLDRLASAMGVKADVDDLTDQLIGHHVDEARRAGCSWSDIGSAMGVTKQAAQQRHTGERHRRHEGGRGRVPVFGRFTQRARTSVREANLAAVETGADAIGAEHLLAGILAVPRSLAAMILVDLGFHLSAVGAPRRGRRQRVPFSADAKRVLEDAMRQAGKLGHNYIGTEHLLLALCELPQPDLAAAGITHERVRNEVLTRLQAAS
jgi:hypothetical protein